jgi:hypothetical protein
MAVPSRLARYQLFFVGHNRQQAAFRSREAAKRVQLQDWCQGGMLIALDEHGFSHAFMLTQSREHGTRSQTDPGPIH